MPTRRSVLAALAAAGPAGCARPARNDTSTDTAAAGGTVTPPAGDRFWYTHSSPTGNRTLQGAAAVDGTEPTAFEPGGQPQWLVAHPGERGSYWTVASGDGRVSTWRVRDSAVERVATHDPLDGRTQPVVATGGDGPRLLRPPTEMAPRTSPLVDPRKGDREPTLCYVAANGDLVVGDDRTRVPVDALRDGRPAALGDGRYALLTAPSDRYAHGALGDTTEGTTLTVVDARGGAVDWRVSLDMPTVFEGLQPLVADLDGDGEPEVVTTVADSSRGARIAVFSAGGERLATGPAHSPGWRHQLVAAPLGPDGATELAVVRKPHVDHVLEFYRLDGGSLDIVATAPGVSTHTYGSRILDGAVAGDFDGDGRTEALAPTTDRTALVAVRRDEDGARAVWRKELPGAAGSNVTGTTLAGGGLAVGAASGGTVTVWQTER